MKIIRFGVFFFLLLIITPTVCSAYIAAVPLTAYELAQTFRHVFVANVTSKIIDTDRTNYVFHVVEYLTASLNSSTIYFTAYGGSEIAVTPATTFYLGKTTSSSAMRSAKNTV